jgi:hypothetical protein
METYRLVHDWLDELATEIVIDYLLPKGYGPGRASYEEIGMSGFCELFNSDDFEDKCDFFLGLCGGEYVEAVRAFAGRMSNELPFTVSHGINAYAGTQAINTILRACTGEHDRPMWRRRLLCAAARRDRIDIARILIAADTPITKAVLGCACSSYNYYILEYLFMAGGKHCTCGYTKKNHMDFLEGRDVRALRWVHEDVAYRMIMDTRSTWQKNRAARQVPCL